MNTTGIRRVAAIVPFAKRRDDRLTCIHPVNSNYINLTRVPETAFLINRLLDQLVGEKLMLSCNGIKNTALVLALFLTGCVEPTTPPSAVATAPDDAVAVAAPVALLDNDPIVTEDYLGGGGSWGGIGRVVFRYAAIARNNEIYICGAYTGQGSPNIRRLTREVMKQASVTANGETIMRNLRFFAEASNARFSSRLVGAQTNCGSTGLSLGAVPLDSLRVVTRPGRYSIGG